MTLDSVLNKHKDTDLLNDAIAKDEALGNLLDSFNDLAENKEIVCTVNPHRVQTNTTVGQLKYEMAKLDTEEQLDLLSKYAKQRKHMEGTDDTVDKITEHRKSLIVKKTFEFCNRIFTVMSWMALIITLTIAYGYIKNGTLEKDVLFKFIDSFTDVLKLFIGSTK